MYSRAPNRRYRSCSEHHTLFPLFISYYFRRGSNAGYVNTFIPRGCPNFCFKTGPIVQSPFVFLLAILLSIITIIIIIIFNYYFIVTIIIIRAIIIIMYCCCS